MKLGLYGINLGPCADPEAAASVARAAEEAGGDVVPRPHRTGLAAVISPPP